MGDRDQRWFSGSSSDLCDCQRPTGGVSLEHSRVFEQGNVWRRSWRVAVRTAGLSCARVIIAAAPPSPRSMPHLSGANWCQPGTPSALLTQPASRSELLTVIVGALGREAGLTPVRPAKTLAASGGGPTTGDCAAPSPQAIESPPRSEAKRAGSCLTRRASARDLRARLEDVQKVITCARRLSSAVRGPLTRHDG